MAFKKSYSKKASKKSYKKKTFRRKAGKKNTFAAKVKKVMYKAAEHKVVSTNNVYPVGTPAATTWTTNTGLGTGLLINLVPNGSNMVIAQGVGQGDRIGNKIRTVSCKIKMIFFPAKYDATVNPTPVPLDVRLLVISNKQSQQTIPVAASLYQSGDSVYALGGQLRDNVGDINRNLNHLYRDKSIKVGYANDAAAGPVTNQQFYANNDYKMNKMITMDVTKYVPKIMEYNDTGNNIARYVYLGMIPNAADGSVQAATATSQLYVQYEIVYKYTDI